MMNPKFSCSVDVASFYLDPPPPPINFYPDLSILKNGLSNDWRGERPPPLALLGYASALGPGKRKTMSPRLFACSLFWIKITCKAE